MSSTSPPSLLLLRTPASVRAGTATTFDCEETMAFAWLLACGFSWWFSAAKLTLLGVVLGTTSGMCSTLDYWPPVFASLTISFAWTITLLAASTT